MSIDTNLLAFDTETSGLDIRAGCRPFFVVLQEPYRGPVYFEWNMNPFTRTPEIPDEDILDLAKRFEGKQVIGHNVKYDILALQSIGVDVPAIVGWDNVHDTMLMAHAYQSGGNQGLKELCVRHLAILDDDERRLGRATVEARRAARKLQWAIASPTHPHFRSTRRFGKNNAVWKPDMWLPRAIALHEKRPEDDAWYTVLRDYAITDGIRTLDLFLKLSKDLEQVGLYEQYELNRKLLEITYESEARGITMIPNKVSMEKLRFQKNTVLYEQKAKQAVKRLDMNINSTPQVAKLIYQDYLCPVMGVTKSGKPSVDAETLVRLLPQAPPDIQAFITNYIISKKFKKGSSDLIGMASYLQGTRIHCNMKITGAKRITRMSVVDPPLQTVAKHLGAKEHWPDELKKALEDAKVTMRTVFGPEPGWEWFALDLVQAHPRIFAWLSGDEEAQKVFNEGKDYYVHLAAGALGISPDKVSPAQRSLFKMVNLADMYGVGDTKLEKNTGMSGLKQLLAEQFPSRATFLGKIRDSAAGKGYITTAGGYRLYCPDLHKLVNYVIIGTEGRIMKQAMIYCHRYLKSIQKPDYTPYLGLSIHDELVFIFPNQDRQRNLLHVNMLGTLMERAALDHGVCCPVETSVIDYGTSWADKKKLEQT